MGRLIKIKNTITDGHTAQFCFLGLLLLGELGITALAKQKSSSTTSNDYKWEPLKKKTKLTFFKFP